MNEGRAPITEKIDYSKAILPQMVIGINRSVDDYRKMLRDFESALDRLTYKEELTNPEKGEEAPEPQTVLQGLSISAEDISRCNCRLASLIERLEKIV